MRPIEPLCKRYQVAAEIITKRWTALIIKALMNGPMRFSEITEYLCPVSDRVLAERLKELEREQIILRRVWPESPIRVEYALTEKGYALSPIIEGIEAWSQTWIVLQPDSETPLNPPADPN
ncbi:MAG: helix-turn-helix domain-containing protein [Chloroflexota bacterium]